MRTRSQHSPKGLIRRTMRGAIVGVLLLTVLVASLFFYLMSDLVLRSFSALQGPALGALAAELVNRAAQESFQAAVVQYDAVYGLQPRAADGPNHAAYLQALHSQLFALFYPYDSTAVVKVCLFRLNLLQEPPASLSDVQVQSVGDCYGAGGAPEAAALTVAEESEIKKYGIVAAGGTYASVQRMYDRVVILWAKWSFNDTTDSTATYIVPTEEHDTVRLSTYPYGQAGNPGDLDG